MDTVDTRVIEIALERSGGVDFENFAHGFFASSLGIDYVPMGGIHDGGADGSIDDKIFEASGAAQKFLQASISADPKRKIRHTIRRLREFGRAPSSLIYATNQRLPLIDQLQENLSDELDCRIVIRDGHFFQHQINDSPGALQAYKSYLAPNAAFLSNIGGADTVKSGQGLPAKSLCVFIGQELDRRRGKTELLEAVVDSLILWALEGTDPDKGIFLGRNEIERRVLETLPSAKTFFKGVLSHRLEELTSRGDGGARKINFHKKENGYCLPFATRERIREENVEDENLRLHVSDIFRSRASVCVADASDNQPIVDHCVNVCHSVIHKAFHAQGLEMSLFVERNEGSDFNLPSITDLIDQSIAELGLVGAQAGVVAQACITVLRGTYYQSTSEERRLLQKLCRTYMLLFMLKNEPRIVEYFRSMTANFRLYVGSDLIVRCLSEQMLSKNDQMTRNTLLLMSAAGSKLMLTEKTLDEVWHHFKTSNLEFVNHYQEIQNFMTPMLASQIDRILIRAFFYYRFECLSDKKQPMSWSNFIDRFLTARDLSRSSSRDELREYLVNEFGFVFEDEATMLKGVDLAELDTLANSIFDVRSRNGREDASEKILARNAALTVLRVYQSRRETGERSGGNPFGYKTWWLTQQTRVQSATNGLVARHNARYMMRPEFLLHFLAVLPSKKEVQSSYDQIFPTILGVKLGNRMDEASFKRMISDARDVYDSTDESRARVKLSIASARLQSDFMKRYEDGSFFNPI